MRRFVKTTSNIMDDAEVEHEKCVNIRLLRGVSHYMAIGALLRYPSMHLEVKIRDAK